MTCPTRSSPKPERTVTAGEIEIALDRIAEIMVARGSAGVILIPFYERLEHELELARSTERKMVEIRERARLVREKRNERRKRKTPPE